MKSFIKTFSYRVKKKIKGKIEDLYGGIMVDTSLRYLPVVSLMRDKKLLDAKVLELGSGWAGLTQFLPIKITGVDTKFEAKNPLMEQVEISATKLPFEESSFDVVIAVDLLEHLAKNERKKALGEMMRIAREWIIINNPCGQRAYAHDAKLAITYKRIFKKKHFWFEEHLKNKLPSSKEIIEPLTSSSRKYGKRMRIEVRPNLNLTVRHFLMRSWITKSFLLHILDRTLYILLLPLLARMNWGECYRKLFIIQIL